MAATRKAAKKTGARRPAAKKAAVRKPAAGRSPARAPRRSRTPAPAPAGIRYEFHPVTPARWNDLEKLFGPRGACAGCWCQYARRSAAEYQAGKGEGNRRELRRIVGSGAPVGVLAYVGGEAVGWCAIAPRADYPRLAGSRILAPVDARAAWSIPCQFVAREHRGRGLTVALIRAAAEYARTQGAAVVEGYPVDTGGRKQPAAFVWWGTARAFEAAGFREVARRSATRPIMRLEVAGAGPLVRRVPRRTRARG